VARIRSIKPEFFDDEDLAALSVAHRLCFVGLWTQADKAGRMDDRPARLKVRIFPFDDVDMDTLLADLVRAGFVVRYVVGGKPYLAVRSWAKHQRPRDDENESVIPAPMQVVDTPKSPRSDGSVTPQSLGKEGEGKGVLEGKGRDVSAEAARSSASAPAAPRGFSETREPDEPALLTFPTVGAGGSTWTLTASLVADLQQAFPGVDIVAEGNKALGWLKVSPDRRKTAKGMPKFLYGWITRSVNRGDAVRIQTSTGAVVEEIDWFDQCKELHGGTCGGQLRHHNQMLIDDEKARMRGARASA